MPICITQVFIRFARMQHDDGKESESTNEMDDKPTKSDTPANGNEENTHNNKQLLEQANGREPEAYEV